MRYKIHKIKKNKKKLNDKMYNLNVDHFDDRFKGWC